MPIAVIVDAVRTPGGKRNGKLKNWHPADLASETLKAIVERNNLDPALVDSLEQARRFRQRRHELQEGQVGRLASELPLAQLRVPYLFTDAIGPGELDTLSQALAAGIEALHETDPVAR